MNEGRGDGRLGTLVLRRLAVDRTVSGIVSIDLKPPRIASKKLTAVHADIRDEDLGRPGSQVASIVGDPAAARETVARFQDIGVDEVILVMQMGTVPHELIMESLRAFAEKVMPHFA